MYRRCVLCGWGRKECLESVKFYCIPREAGLQRFQWMVALSEKRNSGFKKVDSVCSIHFQLGKPSADPSHVDFVPNLYMNRHQLPESLRKSCLRHFSTETEEVAAKRAARLKTLNTRMKILRSHQSDPRDAWMQRKRARSIVRQQNPGHGYQSERHSWQGRAESVIYVDDDDTDDNDPLVHKRRQDGAHQVGETSEDYHCDEYVEDEDEVVEVDDDEAYINVAHEEIIGEEDYTPQTSSRRTYFTDREEIVQVASPPHRPLVGRTFVIRRAVPDTTQAPTRISFVTKRQE